MKSGPLRSPQFRLLLAGRAISALGDRLVPVALAFAVLDLTHSVTDLSIVFAAQSVPLVAFVLIGGVWADRLPRQLVMLVSDAVRAVAQGLSAALLLSGSAHIWELAALQALYGAAEAFFGPASVAIVAQTVSDSQLQPANALLGMAGNLANVLGPAVAGVIVATTGPGWGLAADGATFVASAAFLAPMAPRALLENAPAEGAMAALRAGWHAFRARTWLWVTVVYFTIFLAFVYSPLQVLGPAVSKASLGGAGAWAAILASLGVGSVVGGVIGLRWRPRHPLRAAFVQFLISGPALVIALAARAPLAVIIAVALVDGSTGSIFNVFWFTALQHDVPASEQSRVSSWDYLGSLALQPVGLAATGPIAAAIGVSTTLYGAGILFALLTLAALAIPAVRNFDPASAARAPGSEASRPA